MGNDSLWFLFHEDKLLLFDDGTGKHAIPRGQESPLPVQGIGHSIGMHAALPCIACGVDSFPADLPCTATDLRSAYSILGAPLYALAGKGFQMVHWDRQSQYCSVCGAKTEAATCISKRCPSCGQEIFPHITNAILALVQREDSVLLVRGVSFKGANYGLVAGFLEPGETLEQCVQREVQEETGLAVGNVTYFGCQPWPYPSGLMIGFIADYLHGEIVLQREELACAEFFQRGKLPELPRPYSLARRMIDWWQEAPM